MSTIGLKLTIWSPKQCSVIEKVRKLFLEIIKNLSKIIRSVHFLISSRIMVKVETARQNEHNWTKIDDLVTKTMFGDGKSSETFFGNR